MCEVSLGCRTNHIKAPHGVHVCDLCSRVIAMPSACRASTGICQNRTIDSPSVCTPSCGQDPRTEEVLKSLDFETYVEVVRLAPRGLYDSYRG